MDKRTWTDLIVHEIKDQLETEFEVCDGPGAIVTCVGGGGLAIGKFTDYRYPMNETCGLGQTIGLINSRAVGVFSAQTIRNFLAL